MQLKAHAKINLALSVRAKRPDGFHELDTLFARLALHDIIQLEQRPQGISCNITPSPKLKLAQALPSDKRNLAVKAAQMYFAAANMKQGLHIILEKNIPIAAGLGGGSADAAAVLRGLKELFPSEVDIVHLAGELGSDVTYFVHNIAAARGQGRGELLKPISLPALHLVLVNPGIAVSAGEAYQALSAFTPALKLPFELHRGSINALQAGIVLRYPEIARVLDILVAQGLQPVLMSGSGSTCFGIAQDEHQAQRISAQLKADYPQYYIQASHTM